MSSGEEDTGAFAGTIGIVPKWHRKTTTFGIWPRPKFRRRGYSGERAAAIYDAPGAGGEP
jgi:RimJ/RimL family protein N-acetyltransferase